METVINYLFHHHDILLYLLAFSSLLVELTLISLSGPLLFFAIGCAITGVLVSFDIVVVWEMELFFIGLCTLLSSLLLWKPFKHFQGNVRLPNTHRDMIGQRVAVHEILSKHGGSIKYSGVNWPARLSQDSPHESIAAGEYVKIHAVEGKTMIMK